MSYNEPIPVRPVTVEADPRKPWKAVAAFLVSLVGLAWVSIEKAGGLDEIDTLNDWLAIHVPALLTAAAVYVVRNPKVTEPNV
jgi:hypothetical protein